MENVRGYEPSVMVQLLAMAPSAASIPGMLFYSFIVFLVLNCLRRLRTEALYPRLADNMQKAGSKRREEIRKEREVEAKKLAEKLS